MLNVDLRAFSKLSKQVVCAWSDGLRTCSLGGTALLSLLLQLCMCDGFVQSHQQLSQCRFTS